MVVIAGGSRILIAPVVTHVSDVSTVENLGAVPCGTGDVTLGIVPVDGPTFDCSLFHSGFDLRDKGLGNGVRKEEE